ncbi:hypothetical protein BpHYR1_051274 [Brachionus plicatilis]|uniref:Uncharacterized protein n=1 Tax=Brachionus plicatilis TaxID=10195 RepID=A0A3M7T8G7_BRAPC|nr:hypothetical protein BpHYR1_051274 [Brachionus plicatilis]
MPKKGMMLIGLHGMGTSLLIYLVINRRKNTNLYACKSIPNRCYHVILPGIIQLKLLGNLNRWNTYLKPTKIYSKV